ncbi:MAG: hypothetical protein WCC26_11940 [Terracidiphilus sp.]
MLAFGRAAFIGLCFGLIWGIGCSLVLLYSIYLAGYRKAVKDSLAAKKVERFIHMLEQIKAQRAEKAGTK